MESKTALISIHPNYVKKIFSGEKKLEFRRRWATRPVETLFIYATAPIQRIVGLAKIVRVTQGTPTQLWQLTKTIEGGISRRELFAYLNGSRKGVAIELGKVRPMSCGIDPRLCFGRDFRPPQSFRYLKEEEIFLIKLGGKK